MERLPDPIDSKKEAKQVKYYDYTGLSLYTFPFFLLTFMVIIVPYLTSLSKGWHTITLLLSFLFILSNCILIGFSRNTFLIPFKDTIFEIKPKPQDTIFENKYTRAILMHFVKANGGPFLFALKQIFNIGDFRSKLAEDMRIECLSLSLDMNTLAKNEDFEVMSTSFDWIHGRGNKKYSNDYEKLMDGYEELAEMEYPRCVSVEKDYTQSIESELENFESKMKEDIVFIAIGHPVGVYGGTNRFVNALFEETNLQMDEYPDVYLYTDLHIPDYIPLQKSDNFPEDLWMLHDYNKCIIIRKLFDDEQRDFIRFSEPDPDSDYELDDHVDFLIPESEPCIIARSTFYSKNKSDKQLKESIKGKWDVEDYYNRFSPTLLPEIREKLRSGNTLE